ncbi:MAG TPA: hypothetical protein VNR38_07760 [Ureibacillus sp.]|nr:hypothetical protein [Ureibacillus sp.]
MLNVFGGGIFENLVTNKCWEEFEVLNFTKDEDRNYFSENFIGVPIQDWISPLVTIYQEGQQSDFPPGLLSVPIFSEKAIDALYELLKDQVQLFPFNTTNNKK